MLAYVILFVGLVAGVQSRYINFTAPLGHLEQRNSVSPRGYDGSCLQNNICGAYADCKRVLIRGIDYGAQGYTINCRFLLLQYSTYVNDLQRCSGPSYIACRSAANSDLNCYSTCDNTCGACCISALPGSVIDPCCAIPGASPNGDCGAVNRCLLRCFAQERAEEDAAKGKCDAIRDQCDQGVIDQACTPEAYNQVFSCADDEVDTPSVTTTSTSISSSSSSSSSSSLSSSSSSSTSSSSSSSTSSSSSSAPGPSCTAQYRFPFSYARCPTTQADTCINGGRRLVPNNIVAISNGCGATGNNFTDVALRSGLSVFAADFQSCCNAHDVCFGTCSLGNDYQFEVCNARFLGCMTQVCFEYGSDSLGPLFPECLSRAVIVAGAVEVAGCGPYERAQAEVCECQECRPGLSLTNRIVDASPALDLVQSTCASASLIANDWTGFIAAFREEGIPADPTESAGILYYASLIGIDSNSTSIQIAALSSSCAALGRRMASIGPTRKAVSLSDYISTIGDTDIANYVCRSTDEIICTTAFALVALTRIRRRTDSSQSSSVSQQSTTAPHVISTSTGGMATESMPFMSGSITSADGTTGSLVSVTAVMPTATLSTSFTTMSAPSSSTQPGVASDCKLIKIYGDSPDTPDSPDGQSETPEIPNYPGGYYYLCEDGTVPPLSILPFHTGSGSSGLNGTPTLSASGPKATVSNDGECTMRKTYGDSPDTPDSPDSPESQSEGQETPETPQDPNDPAYYWQCT